MSTYEIFEPKYPTPDDFNIFMVMPDQSMAPRIEKGDYLNIYPIEDPDMIENGDIVVVEIDGEYFVRRWQRYTKGKPTDMDIIALWPTNTMKFDGDCFLRKDFDQYSILGTVWETRCIFGEVQKKEFSSFLKQYYDLRE